MKHNKLLVLLLAFCVAFAMMPMMAFAEEMDIVIAPAPKTNDIVIYGTSDIHCGIEAGLGYAGIAQVVKDAKAANNYVALVDCGDAIQGDVVGALSKGEYIIDIMNAVGYDICVPGNHEFDYGMDQFLNTIVKNNKATYVSCNFVKEGKPVFDAYKMMTFGDKKVAFVGVCTPQTITKSTPVYFQDANGKYIYDFLGDETGTKLFAQIQATVDEAKKAGADYVVALTHIGNDAADSGVWYTESLVKNTTGIDAVIDGHAHLNFATTMKNKDGKDVKAVAPGTKAEFLSKVVINEKGVISVENIDATMATAKDADVQKVVDEVKAKYETLTAKVVAKTTVDLKVNNAEGKRIVRSRETNLGDLCADAYRTLLGTDVAFVNGGGVRAELPTGNITYGQIISVHPFGNMACSVKVTGQQILDALEWGYKNVTVDIASENGGFLQVSGLTCDINPYIASPCKTNEQGEWAGFEAEAPRKVSNVKIGGKDLDPAATYTLASHNYMLKNGGDGYTMFGKKNVELVKDEVMVDNEVLINYITKTLNGVVGDQYKEVQGRIHMLTADEAINPVIQKLEIAEYMPSVKVTSSKKNVTLKWNACTAENVKYQVYKSTKSSKGFKKAITTSKTSYKTTKLTKGKTYYFKVRATKTIGGEAYNGHYSKVVKGKIA